MQQTGAGSKDCSGPMLNKCTMAMAATIFVEEQLLLYPTCTLIVGFGLEEGLM